MEKELDRLLTAKEVAARCAVSPKTVWKWADEKVLASVRLGRRALRFTEADIQRFIEAGRRGT